MTQPPSVPASKVQEEAAPTKTKKSRSPARKRQKKVTCRHSIFRYEDKRRRRMICVHCGRHRRIKIEKDGFAAAGRWVKPRVKKEKVA